MTSTSKIVFNMYNIPYEVVDFTHPEDYAYLIIACLHSLAFLFQIYLCYNNIFRPRRVANIVGVFSCFGLVYVAFCFASIFYFSPQCDLIGIILLMFLAGVVVLGNLELLKKFHSKYLSSLVIERVKSIFCFWYLLSQTPNFALLHFWSSNFLQAPSSLLLATFVGNYSLFASIIIYEVFHCIYVTHTLISLYKSSKQAQASNFQKVSFNLNPNNVFLALTVVTLIWDLFCIVLVFLSDKSPTLAGDLLPNELIVWHINLICFSFYVANTLFLPEKSKKKNSKWGIQQGAAFVEHSPTRERQPIVDEILPLDVGITVPTITDITPTLVL